MAGGREGAVRVVLRLILLLAPHPWRSRFGSELEDALLDGLRDRRASGRSGRRFLLESYVGVARAGLAERIRPTYRHESNEGEGTMGVKQWMGVMWGDLRLAVRGAVRRPLFSVVVIVTLALGIGVNTAIFSVVRGVLLTPLPYNESEELLWLRSEYNGPDPGRGSLSYPDIEDLNREVGAFERLVGYGTTSMTLTGSGDPSMLTAGRLTDGLLDLFRLAPVLGRDIRADEFGVDAPEVAVIGYALWQDHFGGEPGVIGRTLTLNGVSYEVVGVAPEGFEFPAASSLWIPRQMDVSDCGRGCHTMSVVGRLAPGATLEAARSQSQALALRLQEEYRDTNLYKSFYITTLQDEVVGDVRAGLYLMLGAVGLVLLIACANVATLLLVRGAARAGDTSVRAALGAGRRRLIAQSLVESGFFAVLGAIGGLVVAFGIVDALPGLAADRIPRIAEVRIDGPVLAFTVGTMVLVTLLFGLLPALASGRRGRVGLVTRGENEGRGERGLRGWLLAGEVALCTVLLVGSGLLIRTFQELYAVDLGYQTEDILRFSLVLPDASYGTLDQIHAFYDRLENEIRALPDVVAAGSAWSAPLSRGSATGTVLVDGRPEPTVEEEREASIHSVTPGWLETMGIRAIQGRTLTDGDAFGGEPVALINEQLARDHFPDSDPVGERLRVTVDVGYGSPTFRVVGVIPDLRERTITETGIAGMWVPVGQFGPENLSVSVQTRPGAAPVLPQIREIVRSLDPNLPLYRIETLQEAVFNEIAPTRFYVILTVAFALLAALLAAVGLYGVAAFSAARRTREIGLRVALGADRGGILRLVIGQGMRPAIWGLTVGLVVAFVATGVLDSLLYGVPPRDPVVFGSAALLLVLVASLASALPARMASRTDPMEALRTE